MPANILITGANGQLGCELRTLGAQSRNCWIYTDIAELDITDAAAVGRFVERNRIDTIINCAAYTDVERAEEEPQQAMAINCTAAANLAAAALRRNALLIHISTDYVFDGRACTPYTEDAATAPLNVYGRTKLEGEKAVTASGCRHIILRTAWLYSPYGRNFVKTMLRLTAERQALSVVADQTGTPTYAADLARVIFDIVESGSATEHEGLYHFTNEGDCTWCDFARAIAAEADRTECRIEPCTSQEYPAKAIRPAWSVLDKSKFKRTFGVEIPHWHDALKRCMAEINSRNSI